MDKIILTADDIDYILKWRDEHNDCVRACPCPLKSVEIISLANQTRIKGFREGDKLKLYIYADGVGTVSYGHLVFLKTPEGLWIKKKDTILGCSDYFRQSALTVYASLMAYMVFGNNNQSATPSPKAIKASNPIKTTKSTPKKKPTGVTYIFKHTGKTPTLIVQGSRSSPGVEFSVRGHYRHYKNGKVVWIAQYTKGSGSGKRKDKRYRLGDPEDK